VTNGAQPLAAVVASGNVYDTFMGVAAPDFAVEFPHGYTYSAHPVACAAGIATLDVLVNDEIVARAAALAPYFEDAVHSLAQAKHVIDIRNFGLAAGIGIAATVYAILAFNHSAALAFPILGISALQGLVQPSLTALMSQRAPADAQGEMQGFIGSLNAIASIAAPLLFNPVLAMFTAIDAPVRFPGAAFLIAGGFGLAAFTTLALARQRADAEPI